MITFSRFRRKYMSFRVGQFRQLGNISDITEICSNSVLHILDNFSSYGKVNYCPALDNPILGINNYKQLMTHISDPEVSGPVPVVTNKMILTNAGLVSQFMNYKRELGGRVMFYPDITSLPQRPSTIAVCSYNSLFRARIMGIRRKPRFMNMLLAVVLNTLMKAQDKQHFIHIPLEAIMFERKDFVRVFRKYDRISTKYPEISSYLFLAHLYSILMKPMILPPRGEELEEEEDSVESLEPPECFGMQPDIRPDEFFNNVFNYMVDNVEVAAESLRIKDTENPYKVSIFEYIPPRMFEKINFILTCGGQYIIYNLRDLKELNGRSGAGLIRIIKHINLLAACGNPSDVKFEEPPMVAEDVVEVDDSGTKANQPEFVQPMTSEEKHSALQQDLDELDNFDAILEASVKTQEKPLTVAQKEHVREISQAYKQCKVNGKTVQELLSDIPEVGLTVASEKDSNKKTTEKKETKPTEAKASDPAKAEAESKLETPSSTATLDAAYVQNTLDRDIASILTSFNKQGMFLVGVDQEEHVDDLNANVTYVAKYEDTNHRKHTIRFTLPKLDEYGRYKDNGSYKTISKQRVANPILKASDKRVTLNSNYNKLLVERNDNAAHSFWNWFMNVLKKGRDVGFKTMVVHGTCKYPIQPFPFELTEIGSRYTRVNYNGGALIFDIMNRASAVPEQAREKVSALEKELKAIWFGYRNDEQFFITVTGSVTVRNVKTEDETFYGAFLDFMEWLTGIELRPMVEYTQMTILSKVVPLIHPLAYRYGLTNMLKYTGCDYDVFDINARIERRTSDIVIKFSDKKLVIHRNPRNNALLFGGLCIYDFSNFSIEDMDEKDVYYEMLTQKGIRTNLIKGIDSLMDLFIDPITKDVLREMHEPTDIRDLLLRANTMLTTSEHKDPASASNFRFRGVEQYSGLVYNEMAKAFATYQNRSIGATNKFSISDFQVKARIAKEQLTENVGVINPLADVKTYSKFSNSGSGGRGNDTFMIPDRQFTEDQIGVVSEATVDNGKAGMNAMLPFDPVIVNTRGMCSGEIDISKLQPENVLSLTSLIYPGATNDDGKRANFLNIHASHYVPIAASDVSRVRTGFEEVVAHRCCEPCFAYAAKQGGKIVDIDDNTKTLVIQYKDGTKLCLNYGSEFTNNAGSYVNQEVVVNNFKVGDTFKAGDILTYNRQFFQADPYSKQVRWKIGILAKVAIMDNGSTIEDAGVLTKPLCDRMVYNPVHMKEIVITKDTNVHAFADVGAHVMNTDPLMVFDQSAMDWGMTEDDPDLAQILSDLNKSAPKAGHTGEVVKIDVLYKSPISEMSTSLQKIVKKVVQLKNAKALKAEDCDNKDSFQKSAPLVATTKVGTQDLTADTVIFRFYIRQNMSMRVGDKLFFDSSLKSVCSCIYPDYIYTESGEKIEAMTSARGILARLITSPFLTGSANSVLERLENNMLEVWHEK